MKYLHLMLELALAMTRLRTPSPLLEKYSMTIHNPML